MPADLPSLKIENPWPAVTCINSIEFVTRNPYSLSNQRNPVANKAP
jgi:hypothetical protein